MNVPAIIVRKLIHILIWIVAISLYRAFNYYPERAGIILVMVAVDVIIECTSSRDVMRFTLSGITAMAVLIGSFTNVFSIWTVTTTIASLASLASIILDVREYRPEDPSAIRKAVGIGGYALLVSGILVMFALTYAAIDPDQSMRAIQHGEENYPVDPEMVIEHDGDITIYKDVTYTSEMPNNTYTVFSVPDYVGVVFYIHGGGFVICDKDGYASKYLRSIMDAGYSVVTIDYPLAPQNRYPDAITAANDAFAYFIRNSAEYSLDTDRIIVAGDSAGSQLAGQLAIIQTSPTYAEEIGIVPAVKGTEVKIKGYISISGLVDMPRFRETGVVEVDWHFDKMGRCAFNDIDYATSNLAHQASVLENVTADFPPSYISDGNRGTFTEQGKDLAKKLTSLGVKVGTNFPTSPTLDHVWELNTTTEMGKLNMEKTLAFMEEYMV